MWINLLDFFFFFIQNQNPNKFSSNIVCLDFLFFILESETNRADESGCVITKSGYYAYLEQEHFVQHNITSVVQDRNTPSLWSRGTVTLTFAARSVLLHQRWDSLAKFMRFACVTHEFLPSSCYFIRNRRQNPGMALTTYSNFQKNLNSNNRKKRFFFFLLFSGMHTCKHAGQASPARVTCRKSALMLLGWLSSHAGQTMQQVCTVKDCKALLLFIPGGTRRVGVYS